MKGFVEVGSGLSIKDRGHGGSLNRDDRVHGSLLIMIELFMNCVLKAEVHFPVMTLYILYCKYNTCKYYPPVYKSICFCQC